MSETITPQQCRTARQARQWSEEDLANAAGLALRTIIDFEQGRRQARPGSLIAIRKTLAKS
ncbi:helix-turn-helix domain-containing protein [Caulobacter zeae]|uniref:helix-turn-helix domain-containing protein n=1 Tax=Caulobacter zeae TaxID=2055137 RepID=UPI000E42CD89|nr:helix-turn-helix domain-containing protein [Caulobacter zeae]